MNETALRVILWQRGARFPGKTCHKMTETAPGVILWQGQRLPLLKEAGEKQGRSAAAGNPAGYSDTPMR